MKALKTLNHCEFHKMEILTLDELEENFALLEDWEQRYEYLIALGTQVPSMPDELKTEATEVKGCVSKVWLYATRGDDGRFHFLADSDGKITKGLVYLVLAAYNGKTEKEIHAVPIETVFDRMGLGQHLSPNRRNGFFAMVAKIRALADPA